MSEPSSEKAFTLQTPPKVRETDDEWKEKKCLAVGKIDDTLQALDLTVGIRKLPFELRAMVFRLVIYEGSEWNSRKGKTPDFIVALRGTEFYDQALQVWYHGTYMSMGEREGPYPYNLMQMKPAAFLALRKLRVVYKVSVLLFIIFRG